MFLRFIVLQLSVFTLGATCNVIWHVECFVLSH